MAEPISMKLGMYVMAPEPILTTYFINPSHQSVRLYVHTPIFARQRLCKILSRFRGVTRDGYGLANGFIDHFYTPLRATSNYNTVADFHITTHFTLSSQSAFTSRCLVTALSNGYSCAMFSLDFSW
jgi:hypothetical protein